MGGAKGHSINLHLSPFCVARYALLYLLFFGGKFPPKRHKNFLILHIDLLAIIF